MNWELYEVWAEDDSGREELIETTKSRKDALNIAKKSLNEGFISTVVYQETEDGDYAEIKRFENG